MSGSGAEKRNHMLAVRAAKLQADGHTAREIAELIGKRPEQIKSIVLKGKRLLEQEAH